jgi:LPS export ABC transporter protein LptC
MFRRMAWGIPFAALLAMSASACGENADVATVPAHYLEWDADGVVFGMIHRFTQEGLLQAVVHGDTAIEWRDSTVVALRGVDLTVYTEEGVERAHVTSRRGTLDTRTERMSAFGDVVMIVPGEGRRLESEELHYDPRGDRIWSDSSFVMTMPGRAPIRGSSFTSDLEFRNFQARGPGD